MKRKILVALAVLVLLAFALNGPNLVRGWRYKRSLEETFRAYSAALINGNSQKAYEYCGDDFRREIPYEGFRSMQEQLSLAYGPLKAVEAGSAFVHGRGSPMRWTAVVEAQQKYDHRDVMIVYEFHLESGNWRLYGFKQLD